MTAGPVQRPETPRDCVREYPSNSGPTHVELKAYDWQGVVRYNMDLPIADDVEAWGRSMLESCQRLYPRPVRLELV